LNYTRTFKQINDLSRLKIISWLFLAPKSR